MLASTFSHKKKAKKTEENAKKAGEGGGEGGNLLKTEKYGVNRQIFYARLFKSYGS